MVFFGTVLILAVDQSHAHTLTCLHVLCCTALHCIAAQAKHSNKSDFPHVFVLHDPDVPEAKRILQLESILCMSAGVM